LIGAGTIWATWRLIDPNNMEISGDGLRLRSLWIVRSYEWDELGAPYQAVVKSAYRYPAQRAVAFIRLGEEEKPVIIAAEYYALPYDDLFAMLAKAQRGGASSQPPTQT